MWAENCAHKNSDRKISWSDANRIHHQLKSRFLKKPQDLKQSPISHLISRLLSNCQINWEIVSNLCGLFRTSELYREVTRVDSTEISKSEKIVGFLVTMWSNSEQSEILCLKVNYTYLYFSWNHPHVYDQSEKHDNGALLQELLKANFEYHSFSCQWHQWSLWKC